MDRFEKLAKEFDRQSQDWMTKARGNPDRYVSHVAAAKAQIFGKCAKDLRRTMGNGALRPEDV